MAWDLDAFYLEHRRYGVLNGGMEGALVWMTCIVWWAK